MQASSSVWACEGLQVARRLGFQQGTWLRSILVHVVVLIACGVVVPYRTGPGFLDAVVLGAYLCLSVVFAAPAAAGSFDPPAPSFHVAMARITACVAYGAAMSFSMVVAGMAVVYSTHFIVVGPDLRALQEIGIFAMTLAVAITSTVAWISVRYSAAAGRGSARVVFMGLLLLFFLNSRRLPEVALTGAAISAVCALASLLMLRKALTR